jgi:hypothetical protein
MRDVNNIIELGRKLSSGTGFCFSISEFCRLIDIVKAEKQCDIDLAVKAFYAGYYQGMKAAKKENKRRR